MEGFIDAVVCRWERGVNSGFLYSCTIVGDKVTEDHCLFAPRCSGHFKICPFEVLKFFHVEWLESRRHSLSIDESSAANHAASLIGHEVSECGYSEET
jgi:hypothetical protein